MTITRRPLYLAADSQAIAQGAARPTLTWRTDNLVDPDTVAQVIQGALTTTATTSPADGSYPITQGTVTVTGSNYQLDTFIAGTLWVGQTDATWQPTPALSLTTGADGLATPRVFAHPGSVRHLWLPSTGGVAAVLDGTAWFGTPPYTWTWSIRRAPTGNPAVFDDATAQRPRLTCTVAGRYLVRLTVTDTTGASHHNDTTVTVHANNDLRGYGTAEEANRVSGSDLGYPYRFEGLDWTRSALGTPAAGIHPRVLYTPAERPFIRDSLIGASASALGTKSWTWWTNGIAGNFNPGSANAQLRTDWASASPTIAWRATGYDFDSFITLIGYDAFRADLVRDIPALVRNGKILGNFARALRTELDQEIATTYDFNNMDYWEGKMDFGMVPLVYDFCAPWMSPQDREDARSLIALAVDYQSRTGTQVNPNNGQAQGFPGYNDSIPGLYGLNSNFNVLHIPVALYSALAIEGEPGSNDNLFWQMVNYFQHFALGGSSPMGHLVEGMGKNEIFTHCYTALSRRQQMMIAAEPIRNHANMYYLHSLLPWGCGWLWEQDLDGNHCAPRGADLVSWKECFPKDPLIEVVHRFSMAFSGSADTNPPNITSAATDGSSLASGFVRGDYNISRIEPLFTMMHVTDFDRSKPTLKDALTSLNGVAPVSLLNRATGYHITRSSWDPDAALLHLSARNTSSGHNVPDRGSFRFLAQGRVWGEYDSYAYGGRNSDPLNYSVIYPTLTPQSGMRPGMPGRTLATIDTPLFTAVAIDTSHVHAAIPAGIYDPPFRLTMADLGWDDARSFFTVGLNQCISGWPGNTVTYGGNGWNFKNQYPSLPAVYRTGALVRGDHPYSVIADDVGIPTPQTIQWLFRLPNGNSSGGAATGPDGPVDIVATTLTRNDAPWSTILRERSTATGSSPRNLLIAVLSNTGANPKPAAVGSKSIDFVRYDGAHLTTDWSWLHIDGDLRAGTPSIQYRVALIPFRDSDPQPAITANADGTWTIAMGDQSDTVTFGRGTTALLPEQAGTSWTSIDVRRTAGTTPVATATAQGDLPAWAATPTTLRARSGTAVTPVRLTAPGATSYAATGLPPGLRLDRWSGLVEGTPTVAGRFTVQVLATNARGSTATSWTIDVSAAAGAPPTAVVTVDERTDTAYDGLGHTVAWTSSRTVTAVTTTTITYQRWSGDPAKPELYAPLTEVPVITTTPVDAGWYLATVILGGDQAGVGTGILAIAKRTPWIVWPTMTTPVVWGQSMPRLPGIGAVQWGPDDTRTVATLRTSVAPSIFTGAISLPWVTTVATAIPSDAANWNLASVTRLLPVVAAPVTVTLTPVTVPADGLVHMPLSTITPALGDYATLAWSWATYTGDPATGGIINTAIPITAIPPTTAGWYAATATVTGLQTGTATTTVTLTAPTGTVATATPVTLSLAARTDAVYDGTGHAVIAPTVTLDPGSAVVLEYQAWTGDPAAGGTVTPGAAWTTTPPIEPGWYQAKATVVGAQSGTATGMVIIGRASPTVVWPSPGAITVGTALGAAQLNATASVAGTFIYTPATGSTLATAGATTLSLTFTPTDSVHYLPVTTTTTLTVLPVAAVVTVAAVPTVIYDGAAHGTTASLTPTDAAATLTLTYQPWTGDPLDATTGPNGAELPTAPVAAGWYRVIATAGGSRSGTGLGSIHILPLPDPPAGSGGGSAADGGGGGGCGLGGGLSLLMTTVTGLVLRRRTQRHR